MSAIAKWLKSQVKILNEHNADIAKKLTDKLDLNEDQVKKMQETLDHQVEEIADLKKRKGTKRGASRAPTKYNIFVKQKIAELKEADPTIDRKQLMVEAAAAWRKVSGVNNDAKKAKK